MLLIRSLYLHVPIVRSNDLSNTKSNESKKQQSEALRKARRETPKPISGK